MYFYQIVSTFCPFIFVIFYAEYVNFGGHVSRLKLTRLFTCIFLLQKLFRLNHELYYKQKVN